MKGFQNPTKWERATVKRIHPIIMDSWVEAKGRRRFDSCTVGKSWNTVCAQGGGINNSDQSTRPEMGHFQPLTRSPIGGGKSRRAIWRHFGLAVIDCMTLLSSRLSCFPFDGRRGQIQEDCMMMAAASPDGQTQSSSCATQPSFMS